MTTDGADRSFGAPRFNVVLRGYNRRQVDEHLSRLQRLFHVLRRGLDSTRSQAATAPPGSLGTPRSQSDGLPPGGDRPDVVGAFIDRMQAIVRAAEKEAGEIRSNAQAAALAE